MKRIAVNLTLQVPDDWTPGKAGEALLERATYEFNIVALEAREIGQASNSDTFRREMEAAGYALTRYKGRDFYDGPAVHIDRDELQDAIRSTTVKVQTDQMGKRGLVVYPVVSQGKTTEQPSDVVYDPKLGGLRLRSEVRR